MPRPRSIAREQLEDELRRIELGRDILPFQPEDVPEVYSVLALFEE